MEHTITPFPYNPYECAFCFEPGNCWRNINTCLKLGIIINAVAWAAILCLWTSYVAIVELWQHKNVTINATILSIEGTCFIIAAVVCLYIKNRTIQPHLAEYQTIA
jgi:hypothetical protein